MSAGSKIGVWVLDRRIGRGGNAEVWVATNAKGHEGAVKIPHSKRQGSEPVQRFRSEVQLLRQLSGEDGIIPLIDSAIPSDAHFTGDAFHVTPLGQTMENFFGDQDLDGILEAFAQISHTLARLALQGIHHRDIKPSNLIEINNRWCLADFGLATFPGKEALTADQGKLGPVYYIAPEMLNREGTPSAEPADVYSLAKTMWTVASGQKYPVPGEHRPDEPALLLRTYIMDARSGRMDALIQRATRHSPLERPTLQEFAQEISAIRSPPDRVRLLDEDPEGFRNQIEAIIKPHVQKQEATVARRQALFRHTKEFLDSTTRLKHALEAVFPFKVSSPGGETRAAPQWWPRDYPIVILAVSRTARLRVGVEDKRPPEFRMELHAVLDVEEYITLKMWGAVWHQDGSDSLFEYQDRVPAFSALAENAKVRVANESLSHMPRIKAAFAARLDEWRIRVER